jgi:hypothetical protein
MTPINQGAGVPAWVPVPVRWYLDHTGGNRSIRAIARDENRHPSTVLRQIRRIEQRRDDPLTDGALCALEQSAPVSLIDKDHIDMTAPIRSNISKDILIDEAELRREARRVLRRLCEKGAYLALAGDLEKAAVLKDGPEGKAQRIAVVSRGVAQAFAVKDWIKCQRSGRIATYVITDAGRAALKRILAEDTPANGATGFAEAPSSFAEQHRSWGERYVMDDEDESPRAMRYNLGESPLTLLARRKDKTGEPFLSPDLVAAGERLREDFELSQMGPRVTQNWDRFLTGGSPSQGSYGGPGDGARNAKDRMAAALRDLGPGLGDVALRCCCFLEGLETAEKRMGWSARSGKIVLRIALQRLRRHYDESTDQSRDMIG